MYRHSKGTDAATTWRGRDGRRAMGDGREDVIWPFLGAGPARPQRALRPGRARSPGAQVKPRWPRTVADAGLQNVPEPVLEVRHASPADQVVGHIEVRQPVRRGPVAGEMDRGGRRHAALNHFEPLESRGEWGAAKTSDPFVAQSA